MRKNSIIVGILAMSVLSAGFGFAANETVTVTGEVIDSACYIKMGAKGTDHAKCALGCAKAGIPLALLTDDGMVVWVASDKDMESANGVLEPYVAKRVTVEGTWFEKGGTKLLAISKVTPASSE